MMENFFLFVLMCVLLILLPGPDFAIVTKNTVTRGKFGGMKTALGTCCALLIHTTAAILGLSALIVKSAFLFSIFKYVGAIYLIYLGIKTFWSLRKKKDEVEVEFVQEGTLSNTSCFKQGFLTNILNPKSCTIFLNSFPNL